MERYQRQIAIPEIGQDGQQKLAEARVFVLGAGGLGSPVLYALCAAGIGTLGIADFDVVSESNLNRQILHTHADIGKLKVQSASEALTALNPDVNIHTYSQKLTAETLPEHIAAYDIVVDCVDSFESRIAVAHACYQTETPVVEAGIEGFSGFVMSSTPGSACFGCLHREATERGDSIPVLGATAGTAGNIQAAECIKLLLGIGTPLVNRMLFFDLVEAEFEHIPLLRHDDCPVCGQ